MAAPSEKAEDIFDFGDLLATAEFETEIEECDALKDVDKCVDSGGGRILLFNRCATENLLIEVDGSMPNNNHANNASINETTNVTVVSKSKGKKRKAVKQDLADEENRQKSVFDCLDELDGVLLIQQIIAKIVKDPSLQILQNSPGWKMKELASTLQDIAWGASPLNQFAQKLLVSMKDTTKHLGGKKISVAGELAMLQDVTKLSYELSTEWVTVLKSLDLEVEEIVCNLLFQRIINMYFSEMLKPTHRPDLAEVKLDHVLTLHEKQVLHYAVGYIPRKLLKRYRRSPANKAANLFEAVVKSWVEQDQDLGSEDNVKLSDPVTYWTRLQDRGGLLYCTPDFFHFMKLIEGRVSGILNWKTLPEFANSDIVLDIVGRLMADADTYAAFKSLLKGNILSEKLCEVLLEQVLMCWVASKAKQVTKQYIFKMKDSKKGNLSKMGTPALRKTLDKH